MSITIGSRPAMLNGRTFFRALFCVLLLLGGSGLTARADEPSVTAVLDNSETVIGQPVQLQIKITGARNATMPSAIAVDGLDIRYSGQSQLMEGRNFQFSYSVIYTYTILPEKAGAFKIPTQAIRVGNTTVKTPELSLNVTDGGASGGGRSARPGRSQDVAPDPGKNAFIELIVAKTDCYVGEMIPAEVRLGFNVRTPVESLGNGIDLSGQGFTTQKMHDPRQSIETIDGKSYQVFVFKTAIAPARSGKISIGPVLVNPIVRMPQTVNRGRTGRRDPFGLSDPFFDNFFNDPAFAPSTPREIKLKSEAATLDVKPLPKDAPPSFSGAVGVFSMTTDAKPRTAQVGDPITITAKISGRGNFDRVGAPTFEDEKGWHTYPPTSSFKQDDDVGISGAKTVETVLSANERKTELPVSVFSYFDPVKQRYVTLRSDRVPVKIEGGTAPAPTPSATVASRATDTPAMPAPSASAAPKAPDILHQLDEVGPRARTFAPWFARPEFWWAQLVPLLGLLGFVAWKLRARRLDDRESLRRAGWQREVAEAEGTLRRGDSSNSEFIGAATRAVQLRAALAKGVEPNSVDAEVAAKILALDDTGRARLNRLFAQADELRYSGSANGSAATSRLDRSDIVEFIESLRR